jgi:hypothetical protein
VDLNTDGQVSIFDYAIFAARFGRQLVLPAMSWWVAPGGADSIPSAEGGDRASRFSSDAGRCVAAKKAQWWQSAPHRVDSPGPAQRVRLRTDTSVHDLLLVEWLSNDEHRPFAWHGSFSADR